MALSYEVASQELIAAFTYGQLRSFAATARFLEHAPDTTIADTIAQLAADEYAAYRALRMHLQNLTSSAAEVLERQKPGFDAFFDQAPLDDWVGSCAFFALGVPLAGDFARLLAPLLDDATARVITDTFGERHRLEDLAAQSLTTQLEDHSVRTQARHLAAELLGHALTGFQQVAADTDALDVLLARSADHAPADAVRTSPRVTQIAMMVVDGHRRRVVALGLEDVEEVG